MQSCFICNENFISMLMTEEEFKQVNNILVYNYYNSVAFANEKTFFVVALQVVPLNF